MALMFQRPALRRDARGLPRPVLPGHGTGLTWLAAGAAILCVSACIYFLLPEASFAIVAGLLILLLALADLRVGFLAFVAIYPFMPLTWGVDLADWMPFFTAKRLCCLVLTTVFLFRSRGAWDTPRVRRIGWFLVTLVAVQTLAGFASQDPLGAVKRTFGDAVEWYMPFLIAAHLFRTKAQVRLLVITALAAMGVAAILAIVEKTINYNFYDCFTAGRDDIQAILTSGTEQYRSGDILARRVRVAFSHPIDLGLHLMCVLLLSVYILRQRGSLSKLAVTASLPLFLLALLYTYSRGPMLGFACGILWLALVGRGTRAYVPVIVLCGLGAHLLMPSSARSVLDDTVATSADYQTGDSIGGGTVRARMNLLEAGLKLSQQNVWFGLGPGQLQNRRVRSGKESVDFTSVDNFYLQRLLRHGAIVLVMTIGLYLYLLGLFTRGALKLVDREAALLSGIAAAMCVANYVALVTVGINITLFWILLGPAVRACDLYQPVGRRKGSTRRHGGTERMDTNVRQITDPSPAPTCRPKSALRHALRPCIRIPAPAAPYLLVSASILTLLAMPALTQAAPSFYGTTGLFATPTAAVAPRGAWSAGANYVTREFRPGASSDSHATVAHHLTLTLLPRLELTALLNNFEGRLGVQRLNAGPTPDHDLAGYTVDRMVGTQYLVMGQRGSRPSVAIGWRDILGTVQQLRAQYGVASLRLLPLGEDRPLTLSLGVGTRRLHGPFGGVEFSLHPRASAILEALRGQVNGGFRLEPLPHLQLDAALMGFRSLGGGLSYRRKL